MKKKIWILVLILGLTFSLAGCSFFTLRAQEAYESPSTYEQQRIDMIAEVSQSVVAVRTEAGHGSGTIFKAEALDNGKTRYYILTNYHVIEDGGEMNVYYGNSETAIPIVDYQYNEAYDIAVVRIETTETFRVQNINPINNNTITEIVKGQDVYAIGTPYELDMYNYVTQGIVSLTSYDYNGISGLAIMHDAEINPGNSGGALFNLNGDFIGVNVAKVAEIDTESGTIAAEGLNFTLNINKIAPIIRSFTEAGYTDVIRTPKLGVTIVSVADFTQTYDASLIPATATSGLVVVDFDYTREAYKTLELYDVIIEANGSTITSFDDLKAVLTNAQFGDVINLKVLRDTNLGTTTVSVSVTLS